MERALKHKFTVGSTVYFTASNVSRPAATGAYEVIRLLPTEGDDCQYRIKSSSEAFERVAKESQLALTRYECGPGTRRGVPYPQPPSRRFRNRMLRKSIARQSGSARYNAIFAAPKGHCA